MSFESEFEESLEKMIPKEHDAYDELQYSDEIYVQVWSHDSGEGAFELYAIIPHDKVDTNLVGRGSGSQLPLEVPTAQQFYSDVERLLTEVTGSTPEIVFHQTEIVDDGVWERDATMYTTHKLTV